MKRSKNWGVQKAGSAPKAQAQSGQQQKTQSTKKRVLCGRKIKRSVSRLDLSHKTLIKGPRSTGPNGRSSGALHQPKTHAKTLSPSDLI
jgi:hypothetical protein